jgi:DNA-binding transcriptional regulator LsrR (DeoR family)
MDLVNILREKYPYLKNIRIVESSYDYGDLKKSIGREASKLFDSLLSKYKNPRVGIGGGSTLFELVDYLKIKDRRIRIFPTALIGRGPEITHVDSAYLAKMLYFKSRPQSKAFVISIPPLPNNKHFALEFLKNLKSEFSEVKWLINAMQDVDIAFVGLGAMIPTGDFDDELKKVGVSLQDLIDLGVIGGINYNWFDSNGNQITNYFPTIGVNRLTSLSKEKSKDIILVAGGAHKINPIKIALKMHMINSIVSDERTIISLIEGNDDNK